MSSESIIQLQQLIKETYGVTLETAEIERVAKVLLALVNAVYL